MLAGRRPGARDDRDHVPHPAPADEQEHAGRRADRSLRPAAEDAALRAPAWSSRVGGIAFPIGVLLYWTTSNLWTMGQQFYVIRNNPAPGTPAFKAKEERDEAKAARHGVAPTAEARAADDRDRRPSRSAGPPSGSSRSGRPASSAGSPAAEARPATEPSAKPQARARDGRPMSRATRPRRRATDGDRRDERRPTRPTRRPTADRRTPTSRRRTSPTTGRRAPVARRSSSSTRATSPPTTSRSCSTSPTSTATSTWTSRATGPRSRSSAPTSSQLVGRDGEVLEALQELTRLAVYRETGERSRLMLDISGYRARASATSWWSWPRRRSREVQGVRRAGRRWTR